MARFRLPHALRALVVPLVALALLLSACGSGSHASKKPPTPAAPATPATPTTTTTAATTTTPLPGAGRPAINVGDKNYGEQFVLGELYRQALVAQGYTASLTRNIGPSEVTLQAMRSGRLDLYPEYIDTWNHDMAHDRRAYPSARAALGAARRHAARFGLRLLDPTPFSDTNAVAVTPAYAAANGLRAIPDLASVAPSLVFGGPLQFQTDQPGLATIGRVYGVVPAQFKALDVGAQADALARGQVEAAAVGTTDGQLQAGHYVLLSDPKHVFGWGNVVPVVPAKVLAAEGPVFKRTLDAVSALLTTPVIRQLNEDVELSGMDPGTVARRFLQANGMIPPG